MAVFAVVIGFYNNLGGIPLFDVDEGAFGEATHEMIMRHDYISPLLYGEPRDDKPILIYWLQAASVSLFGLNEFALRLPSAVAATLWALAVVMFMRRIGEVRGGLLAVCLLATSVAPPIIAKAATADAVLNLFITCTMFSIYLFYRERRGIFAHLSFVFMALGFLTKGPIAVLIPLVVSALFFGSRRQWRPWLRAAFNPRGWALFAVIALPWYVLVTIKDGGGFITAFFGHHNIGRFTGTMEGHGGSVLYYLPVTLIAVAPYTSVFAKLCIRLKDLIKGDLELYMVLWFSFVLIFFSLSSTKLPHYIIYGLPAVFILMGVHFYPLQRRWLAFLPAAALFLLMAALPTLIDKLLPAIHDRFMVAMLQDHDRYFSTGYRVFFGVALSLAVYFTLERRLSQTIKLLVCGLLLTYGVSQFLAPVAADFQQRPVKEAATIAGALGDRVVMWRLDRPSFGIYSGHTVVRVQPRPGDVVVTKSTELPRLSDYQLLYSKNGIVLVRLNDKRPPRH